MQLGLSSLEMSIRVNILLSCRRFIYIYIYMYVYVYVYVYIYIYHEELLDVSHVDQSNYRSGCCYRLFLARATTLVFSSYTCDNRLRTYLVLIASSPGHVMLELYK